MVSVLPSRNCARTCSAPRQQRIRPDCRNEHDEALPASHGELTAETPRVAPEIKPLLEPSTAEFANKLVSSPFTVSFIRMKSRHLCRRGRFSSSDSDDLQQGMRLCLLEKAHLFNPARGNLEAFVTSILNTWVAMALRYRQREKRRPFFKAVSLERTQVIHDGEITVLGTVLLEEDGQRLTQTYHLSSIEEFDQREAVEHAIEKLQPQDRTILEHVGEHGIASAARTFGMSRRQILKVVACARDYFEKAGLGTD